ncbi:MAG: glycosyltransferase [Acidobacteria bacterium]|nr:glycosyltransferase [Acidobacteriota bacterium]
MKFGFITPRYGADISSGPEHACRLLAEHLSERHDIDVITTCGRDPQTWANEYAEGGDRVRGVFVRRFAVNQTHDPAALRQLSARLMEGPHGCADEQEWVRRIGPTSPALIEYLKRHHRAYDALVFYSLYHPTTVIGLDVAPERSIVFPYLRLDSRLRFGLWADVLMSARAVGYLSSAERTLVHQYLGVAPANEEAVGVGVETPVQYGYPRHQQDPTDDMTEPDAGESAQDETRSATDYLTSRGVLFRRRHRLYGRFVLHGGRVEPDNGCEEMLEYFDSYAAVDGDAALVLMGVKLMKIPEERYLRLAGVLPDRERMIAYEAADVTLAPEPDDALAMDVLESFAVGTPALVNARNRAAVDHCRRANAGLYYTNREEFVEALRLLMGDSRLRERLGENGRRYIRQHYRWDAVLGRFERLVAKTRGASSGS